MGSATYPVLGVKTPDMRNRKNHGEWMYARAGTVAYGDVKYAGLLLVDAAVDDEKLNGSADSLLANVEDVPAAGTADITLRMGQFRVCNSENGVVDDGQGQFIGAEDVICWVKVTTAGGAIAAGTPFTATASQVYLTAADLGLDGWKIVAQVAYDQTLAAGVALCAMKFNGDKGLGWN